MEITEKIVGLISSQIGIEKVNQRLSANDDLTQLGMNSLDFIKLVVTVENEFDIEFEDEALESSKFLSLSALCDYVGQKILNRG